VNVPQENPNRPESPFNHPIYGRRLDDRSIQQATDELITHLKTLGIPEGAVTEALFCRPAWLKCGSVHDGLEYPKSRDLMRQRAREIVEMAVEALRKKRRDAETIRAEDPRKDPDPGPSPP
jgi:hypothetical protein